MKLRSQHFGISEDEKIFFAEASAVRCLDLVRHLAQFSDLLPIVIGPKGSGKTTLLHELQRRTRDTWHIGCLDGALINTPEDLLAGLAAAFDLNSGHKSTDLANRLLNHWVPEEGSGRTPVVLVDDAHEMALDALETLLHLSDSLKDTLAQVRIVLFGAEGFLRTLKSQVLRDPAEAALLHALELPAFDEEQTASYLAFRLAAAGHKGVSPFSATEVRDIHQASGGLPGLINEQAQNRLHGAEPAMAEPTRTPSPEGPGKPPSGAGASNRLPWVGVAVVLVTVLVGVGLGGDIADWFSADSEEPAVADGEPSAAEVPTLARKIEPEPETELELELEPEPEPELEPGPEAESEPAPEPESEVVSEAEPVTRPAETIPAEVEPMPLPTPVPVQPPDEIETEIVARAAPEPAVTARPVVAGANGEDWLLAQNPAHYTVQLLASRTEEAMLAYIRQHELDEEAAYYRKPRNDEIWYSLLYGVFPDMDSARAGVAEMPDTIRPEQPWFRTIATVQAEINSQLLESR